MAWPLQPSGPTVRLVMMMGTFPHPPAVWPPPPTSLPLPASSPPLSWARASLLGMGDVLERGPPPFSSHLLPAFLCLEYPPLLMVLLWHQLCPCHTIEKRNCSKLKTLLQESNKNRKFTSIRKKMWHNFVLVRLHLVAILNS